MSEITIIEINDAIVTIDEHLKEFGNRETWNLPGRGKIKKSKFLKMREDLVEIRIKRVLQIIEQYSKAEDTWRILILKEES